ncbi:TPA: SymE family type I addiction module toxin [Providencia stuartii]|uniref:SymE family type I addiction module toxin n=1 Tax=Providencia stuartii TaxID=588 RepID=UPI0013738584|nr:MULTISPECIES: SymE family type I addiction module toxin [Providencia]MCL8327373.1 type I toxin-antitoxin system SymE family toxin [Providencia thailandensis]MDF4176447.1 SymE family type I addiction module toxin [Providencia thailandensis]MDN0012443.1 SymE family type I addiction module toxin [Providencia stuartii]WIJ74899.1 type I toxin-antitoxin system SymE family toxin [Providencia thailandensis]CAK6614415.1 type I toxin-antitoxin system SymE family toxin [Providencia stuartii]
MAFGIIWVIVGSTVCTKTGDDVALKSQKTERYYTVGYAPNGSKASPLPAIHLKGQWLKEAGFETGFTFTVKILNGCLVLIPDSEDIRAVKQ